jgi:hypothetical protein
VSGDWSRLVYTAMQNAGWHDGRRVSTAAWVDALRPSGFVPHAAAEAFLLEFGGLSVDSRGEGRDVAKMSFDLDPTLAEGQKGWFESLEGGTAGGFYPIGEERDGNASLAIDADGIVYLLFNQRRVPLGPGRQALAWLIEGVRD